MSDPPNHLKLDQFSIETHGFGDPSFWESSNMFSNKIPWR